MTVTAEQAADHVGTSAENERLLALLPVAIEMVENYILSFSREIPIEVVDHAVKELISQLWIRRDSPNGTYEWSDGQTSTLPRDPMVSVRPILRSFRGVGPVG